MLDRGRPGRNLNRGMVFSLVGELKRLVSFGLALSIATK
jgi:hypothetical protein